MRDRALLQIVCSDAVRTAADAVDTVVEAAGTTANKLGHPLERIARDVRVVRQHFTVAPPSHRGRGPRPARTRTRRPVAANAVGEVIRNRMRTRHLASGAALASVLCAVAGAAAEAWLAGDHHVHSHFSPDASHPIGDNARMARQFGLDWMVTTDHGGPNHSRIGLEEAYPELLRSRAALPEVIQFLGLELNTPRRGAQQPDRAPYARRSGGPVRSRSRPRRSGRRPARSRPRYRTENDRSPPGHARTSRSPRW